MKKTAKAAALIAAMVLAAGLTACQKKESAGGSGAIKVSAKDAEKAAGYLIMDGTTVMGYKEGLPAKLVIPAGVTEIGKEAFQDCKSLKSVVIQDGVTVIGERAFSGCESITSVVIPEGVTEIGKRAFFSCDKLKSVTIPDGVTKIGAWAFSCCYSLTEVTIPGSVKTIDKSAFDGCDKLESVFISEGVTEIGKEAFNGCTSLKSVTIPASVTLIGNKALDCDGDFASASLEEINYAGTKAQWEEIETTYETGYVKRDEYTKNKTHIGFKGIVNCADGVVRL